MTTNHIHSACLVCASKKVHYDFSLDKYRVEECEECGLMRLNPQPSNEDLANIYHANYFIGAHSAEGQSQVSALKSQTADQYLNSLETYVQAPLQGSLLEIGCGSGDFLVRAAARGLSVTGVEYSEHAAKTAADKLSASGGKVICGEISTLCASSERYDYIVFSDVLEHVRDPRLFLQSVHGLLKNEGIIMVVVPSLDSFSARLMKNKWVEFKPEHLWYFSTATLKRLLYTEGFQKQRVSKAKKILSFDYIAEHFLHYPVQPYTKITKLLSRIIPGFIRRRPFRIVASGILALAVKKQKQTMQKLSVIMAAFNEEKTVQDTIERVLAKKIAGVEIELIIVESQSTDRTREIISRYERHERVKIILQECPRGKGHAIREGFTQVTGDYILIQDADDEYDLEDYDVLLQPLLNGEADFVLGARHGGRAWKMRQFNNQAVTSHFLNLGHWFFTTLVNVCFGLRLKDPFTMYKVFRADCLQGIKFECNRFDFDYELLIKLVRQGYRPIEIPVNYRSRSFKEGKKVRIFRDPLMWLKVIIKLRLQRK